MFNLPRPVYSFISYRCLIRQLLVFILQIQGKIVVYNQPYVNYETTVKYRLMGASQAASKGAIAAIVRSVTGHSLYTPHTGMMTYDSKFPKIPAVCITAEEADLMWRKQQRGK